jgi:uncharacterized membrane protein YcaP (DUF421 family)
MGRAVVAVNQPFFGTIATATVIVLLHRLLAWITAKSKKAGVGFKGEQILLMKDGKKVQHNMDRTNVTEEDILESMRQKIHCDSFDHVKEVYLERSGEISFVKDNVSE